MIPSTKKSKYNSKECYELEEYEYLRKEFNIRKLRAIEGVMITQGKKLKQLNWSN